MAQQFRDLTTLEQRGAASLLRELRTGIARATGKLHRDVFPREELGRDAFEAVLGAMVSMGWLSMEDATFEKEGRTLTYRRVSLTRDGEMIGDADIGTLQVRDSAAGDAKTRKKATPPKPSIRGMKAAETALTPEETSREQRLRAWRSQEAKKQGFAAFCIFSDKTMRAIAMERPATEADLLVVDGMGPAKVARYGEEICRLCAG